MQNPNLCLERTVKEYLMRLDGHLEDGYVIRHETRATDFYHVRLKHMANGNDIHLHADLRDYTVKQTTNHVVTFSCTYAPHLDPDSLY